MFLLNTIIPHNLIEEKNLDSNIDNFFKKIELVKALRMSNITKLRGASCFLVFQVIFKLVFSGKNLYQLLTSKPEDLPFGKDVIYDFLNSCSYNWRKFLLILSSKIINSKIYSLTSKNRVNVLIFDDSLYSRSRSKAVELLSRVHDHASGKYVKGFRMLTMGWSDGNSFIPVAFSLLSSTNPNTQINGVNENIDKRTNGYKRRKEALKKTTETMFDLLKGAVKYAIPVDYVLFDSWFAYPKVIKKVLGHNMQVICRLKAMYRVYYIYKGKKLNLKDLYKKLDKDHKNRVVASAVVGLGKDKNDKEIKAKIIFVKNDNDKSQWIALLSTNIDLDAEEIIRIYGKRWDIEVFFKMNKSYLRLAKEFQGRSYDSMFAHTTIVFTRYIMLTLDVRKNEDEKTFGGMFFEYCDELKDLSHIEALFLIIDLFKKTLHDYSTLTEKKINELLDYFFELLPGYIKKSLMISNAES